MTKTMLINMAEPEECRIALLENSNLEEIYLERDFEHQLVGNVYLGKVMNIEPAMQAAFVDFGSERNGFLHISDISFDALLSKSRLEELGLVRKEKEKEIVDDIDEGDSQSKTNTVANETDNETANETDDSDGDEKKEGQEDSGTKKKLVKRVKKIRRIRKKVPLKEEVKEETKTEDKVDDKPEPEKKTVKKIIRKVIKRVRRKVVAKNDETEKQADEAPSLKKKPEERRRRRGGGSGSGGSGKRGGSGSGGTSARKSVQIQDVLKKGQMILVQVSREAIDHKGAGLTTFISLAGRTLVLTPRQNKVGVSRKIQDRDERQKLKGILSDLKVEKNMGFIIRTSGAGKTEIEINRDLKVLTTRWKKIEAESKKKTKISMLYEESGLAIRALRDLYTPEIMSIIIDDEDGENKVKGWLRSMIPGVAKKVTLHKDARPLFHKFGIEDDFEKIFSRQVNLPSGATLVIEQTEAMVSIDVNTARLRKEKDQNKAIFKANMESAVEIPRQLRLRDLGGIIVCDFIDMVISDHRKQVEKKFAEEVRKDRARIKFSRISQFGMIEISRQRMRQSVERASHEDCSGCDGTGRILKESSTALKVLRQIRLGLDNPNISTTQITASLDVVDFLQNTKREKLLALEKKYGTMIRLSVDVDYRREQFEVRFLGSDNREVKN